LDSHKAHLDAFCHLATAQVFFRGGKMNDRRYVFAEQIGADMQNIRMRLERIEKLLRLPEWKEITLEDARREEND
jgi:hypothetical protein